MARVVLKNVRLSFPDLWVAKEFKEGDGRPRYSATFLVEPGSDNDKNIRAAIKIEAEAKWGKKADAMIKSIENHSGKFCYLDGNIKEYDGYEGMFYLAAHRQENQGAPKVVDKDKSELQAKDGKPYGGCFVNASVDVYAQTGDFPGIRASLIAVQFAADGPAFSSAPATDEDFDDLSSDDETEDDFGLD